MTRTVLAALVLPNPDTNPAMKKPRAKARGFLHGADDEIRTRDPHLGKVMLYQLSHIRNW